jgi:choline dehydrogenase-like flavoprotein
MEPYYTQAEQLYQVHGARGEDPTEPPASAPYPFPAVSHEPRMQQLADDLAAAGHHPFHAPCGVMLNEADMAYSNIPVAGVAHQAGTCRFGMDPETSVLNTDCRAHELDNLYVVDTSFFPSIGAVNPALTAMANALRVGDHLLERLGAGVTQQGTARVG